MQNELDRDQADLTQTPETSAAPKKRFRVEKLEERIAPKKGGHSGGGHGGSSNSGSGLGDSGSVF